MKFQPKEEMVTLFVVIEMQKIYVNDFITFGCSAVNT